MARLTATGTPFDGLHDGDTLAETLLVGCTLRDGEPVADADGGAGHSEPAGHASLPAHGSGATMVLLKAVMALRVLGQ